MPVSSGVARMLLASVFFTAMAALIKAVAGRLPTAEIGFARFALSLPPLYLLLRYRGLSFWPKAPRLVLVRSMFGAVAMWLSFYALGELHLADATMLNQAQPVFVALLAPFLLGERTRPLTLLSVGASLGGVALILQPSLEVGNLAGFAMIAACLSSAFAVVSVRRLSAIEHPLVIVTSFAAFTSLVTLPFCVAQFVVPTASEAWALVGIAACATLGQILMTEAYALESAAVVAAASYVGVPLGVFVGYLAWGEEPGPHSLLGGIIVVLAGLVLVWSRRGAVPGSWRSVEGLASDGAGKLGER